MKIKTKPTNRNKQSSKIKNLISFNNIKNPFKSSKESENFFKKIMEEEMNLSNSYNSGNLNRLLDLYFKGINLYENTPNIEKVNAFIEKSQQLLQSSKAKKVLNQSKTKTPEMHEAKTDSTLIDENEESDCSNKNKIENKQQDNKIYESIYKSNCDNEDDEDKDESDEEDKLKFDFKKFQTIRHNEVQNRHKLNYLSNSIKKVIKEKDNEKQKMKEIHQEYSKIKEDHLKTSIFLEDEIQKQSNNFQKKLLRKKTMIKKSKTLKIKIDTILEENNQKEKDNEDKNKNKETSKKNNIVKTNEKKDNDKGNGNGNFNVHIKDDKIFRNKTPKINSKININFIQPIEQNKSLKRHFSFTVKNNKNINSTNNIDTKCKTKEKINDNDNKENNQNSNNDNKLSVIDLLKEKVNKYFDEYNDEICKYYFASTLSKMSDLSKKKYSTNIDIYEGYQINIKDLLRKQISCNSKEEENILEDDINNLKEEQDHEIEKNNDYYEKLIYDEIAKFKLLGYSKSSPKELDTLKNKIKCELYNELYKILSK